MLLIIYNLVCTLHFLKARTTHVAKAISLFCYLLENMIRELYDTKCNIQLLYNPTIMNNRAGAKQEVHRT